MRDKIDNVSLDRCIIAVTIPAALYAASMVTLVTGPWRSFEVPGYEAFQTGWEAVCDPDFDWGRKRIGLAAAWFANPAIWLALGCLAANRRRGAIAAAGMGCMLCLCVLPDWWKHFIDYRYPGYWVWWASALSALMMALFVLPRPRRVFVEDYGPVNSRHVQ